MSDKIDLKKVKHKGAPLPMDELKNFRAWLEHNGMTLETNTPGTVVARWKGLKPATFPQIALEHRDDTVAWPNEDAAPYVLKFFEFRNNGKPTRLKEKSYGKSNSHSGR